MPCHGNSGIRPSAGGKCHPRSSLVILSNPDVSWRKSRQPLASSRLPIELDSLAIVRQDRSRACADLTAATSTAVRWRPPENVVRGRKIAQGKRASGPSGFHIVPCPMLFYAMVSIEPSNQTITFHFFSSSKLGRPEGRPSGVARQKWFTANNAQLVPGDAQARR